MADAVVQVVLEHLLIPLLEEAQVVLHFKSELKDMNGHLMYMQSYLTDLEKVKRNKKTLNLSLAELRELIYEADDILTDCQIRIDHQSFYPLEKYFQFKTSKKLKMMNLQIEKMGEKLKTYVNPIIGQNNPLENNDKGLKWTTQYYNQDEIVGLEGDIKKIKKWVFEKNEVSNLVGIVGMGGLGKTTIARKIFGDSEVKDHFKKLIWVSVTQHCSEAEILKNMLTLLGGDGNGLDKSGLMQQILQKLSNMMYLIVFDDVWLPTINTSWWKEMFNGLPKRNDSCIIITTRNEEVIRRTGVEETRMHRPDILTPDESWSLFCNIAFPTLEDMYKDPQSVEVAKEIVKKCGGLPLAIKTIGGLLSAEPTISLLDLNRICDNFHHEISKRKEDNSVEVIASLQLSYDELPTHLKSCLLCFSVYPEDCEIYVEALVRWWIGEGFVCRNDSRTALEMAFNCLSDLISRCLVEVVSRRGNNGRVYICKVHDMVRDLTIRMAKEEAFGSFGDSGRQKPDTNTRHLSVVTDENKMDLQGLKGNSKLRAFLLMTNCPLDFRNSGLAAVKSVRVLDLSHNSLEGIRLNDLLAWISSQKRLSYLNLQGIDNLKDLPNSFKKLWNLRILVLAECNNLEKLPQFITTLKKLTILDLGSCPSLQYLPKGLKNLSNLEFLSGFKLGNPSNEDGCRLSDLVGLTQLRELRIEISEEDEIADEELQVLSKFEKLQVLSINANKWEGRDILQNLDKLVPPPHLQELYLMNYCGRTTPKWINPVSLSELRYLHIENGKITKINDGFLDTNDQWKIEGLYFKFVPKLKLKWVEVEKAMPSLKYLEVSHCFKFQSFPCDVQCQGVWRKGGRKETSEN